MNYIEHGLNAVPEMVIYKSMSTQDWRVQHKDINQSAFLFLNSTNAVGSPGTYTYYDNNATSIGVRSNYAISSNEPYIAYAFHSVDGFSKFGSYTGNGSTDGPIVETGFEPAFIMVKRTSSFSDWSVFDNKRNLTNPRNLVLAPNQPDAERTYGPVTFLSNGFQVISTNSGLNSNGDTFLYMCFAADPDTEAPTVAKSFSTVTYTGTGSAQTIDGLGFKPSFLWTKQTDGTFSHIIHDTLNQPHLLITNSTSALITNGSNTATFTDDGFSLEGGANHTSINNSGSNFVAWAWKADDNEPTISGGSALAVYKFEDNANDVRGNYNGTATNITYTTGKFNKAAVFVESNSSEINFNNSLHGSTFSMSFWLKATDMGAGTSATAYSLYSAWIDVNNYFRPVLYGDGSLLLLTKYAGTFKSNLTSTGLITENTWHHIVFNFTPTDTKAYVDGVNVGTFPTYDSISFTSKALGTDRGTPDFTGQIDQLRFYDAALIQENVTALYEETAADNDDLTLGAPGETIISANSNAGFSIVKYEGDGVAGKQVPHGLSAAPELVITKILDNVGNWTVGQFAALGTDGYLKLNTSDSKITATNVWNDTAPTSTVVNIGTSSATNTSGSEYIMYCFHSVAGYSKFGSYTGDGTTTKTITTGFQPDFVMIKVTSQADNWVILDSVRGGSKNLKPNLSNAEATESGTNVEFISTGFKLIGSGPGLGQTNGSGKSYIYAAFKIN